MLRLLYFLFLSFSPWLNVTVEKDLSHPVNHLCEARGLCPPCSRPPQTDDPHTMGDVIPKTRFKVGRGAGSQDFHLETAVSDSAQSLGLPEIVLEKVSDTHAMILLDNVFAVYCQILGLRAVFSLPVSFVLMHTPLSARCDPRDLCWEAVTLRQTQLSGAWRAHTGKVWLVSTLKSQLVRGGGSTPNCFAFSFPS